ncbi:MAG: FAD/NAD(P)-binding oxidoreductase [Bacteroidota bacterium]
MKHVVIIGNGIAGVTAARYIRKMSDCAITMISAESKYFFSRTALMYVYMGHMRWKDIQPYENWFWDKNRINLIQAYVQRVDPQEKKVYLSSGKDVMYDDLVLACGSTFNKFGWPGMDLEGVGGLYSMQDYEYMEYYTKDAKRGIVVGGGLIGIEMAEMLHSRDIDCTFLVREPDYWSKVLPPEESAMVTRHIRENHIDLRLSTELKEIVGDENGRVKGIYTNKGDYIECEWVGLCVGVHANTGFLKDSGIEMNRGILVNNFCETNIENIYAIGDCAEMRTPMQGRRPMEQIWYTAKMMGEVVAMTITGKRTVYHPGIWFNSAKFFDIEYQIYGDVPAQQSAESETLYWESADGKKAIRINYSKSTGTIEGLHLMGVRYRHLVCERWIAEDAHIEEVLKNLSAANFDPEFYAEYEPFVVRLYKEKTGKDIRLNRRSRLYSLIFGKRNDGRKGKYGHQYGDPEHAKV